MHVVRSLTFQHHADDNVDDDNKSLADILHIPEKNKEIAFCLFWNTCNSWKINLKEIISFSAQSSKDKYMYLR